MANGGVNVTIKAFDKPGNVPSRNFQVNIDITDDPAFSFQEAFGDSSAPTQAMRVKVSRDMLTEISLNNPLN